MLVNIGTAQTQNSSSEKILRVIDICKKTSAKLNALTRVSGYMNPDKKGLVMSAFFLSQFAYCHLAWMFHGRELNYKIDRLHERCPHVVYHGTTFSFEELLQKDSSVSIQHRNIQVLVTKISGV